MRNTEIHSVKKSNFEIENSSKDNLWTLISSLEINDFKFIIIFFCNFLNF